MAVIMTGTLPKTLWPGLNAIWGQEYDEEPVEWTALFDSETSDLAWEEDLQTTGFGLVPIKAEMTAVTYDQQNQGFSSRYTHVTYGMGYIVSMEQIMDQQYQKVAASRTKSLAFSMRQTEENVHALVYNRATTSGYNGGDGVVLLSASHPSRAGLWSNILAPAADLSEAALEDMLIQIDTAKDDLGLKINLKGKTLVVPPQLQFEAFRIMNSTLRVDTANNDPNAIRQMGKLPGGVVVNHYLTDTDAWFIRTSIPNGMKHFTRMKTKFTDDNDFDTENLKYKSVCRFSAGWTDPRGIYGSVGA